MDAADETQVTRVADVVTSVLDSGLACLYLHGSAVMGGLRPTSDLDFLAVVRRPLGHELRRRLVTRLLAVSGRRAEEPGRPVELTVIDQQQLAELAPEPNIEFQYGEWLREEYLAGRVPGPESDSDVIVLLDTVHRHGQAIVGPEASSVIPPVPPGRLIDASVTGTAGLLDDLEGDERNVLLTFARMAVTAETGRVVPKDVAADRVASRVTRRDLLHEAAADYRGEAALDWSSRTTEVAACVQELIDLVEALRRGR